MLNKMAREGWKGLVRGFSTAQCQTAQPSSRTENSVRMERRSGGDYGAGRFWLCASVFPPALSCEKDLMVMNSCRLLGCRTPWRTVCPALSSKFYSQCFQKFDQHRSCQAKYFLGLPTQSQKQKPLLWPSTCSSLSCIS